ncbi:MAG TPA: SpoIID/LytB domain-containing protein [Gaiellaceae bacterium]|nr:SpoIID/LytB domain-containing protein [Gaiellaceae bacterium]
METEASSPRKCRGDFTDSTDGLANLSDVLVRSALALAVLLFALTVVAASSAARSSSRQFVAPNGSGALFLVTGHGWGHGVGMGQWGAYGYAQQGYTYQQILAAYYPGTFPGQTMTTSIRVLLASGKKTLTISSGRPITLEDGNGVDHILPAGSTTLTPKLELPVDGGPAQALPAPLTFSPAGGSTLSLGRAYRGQIVVDVAGGKLRAINTLPLEQYLYGVVPAEMPSGWLPAALEAQAVAARSYALANRRAGAPFDVYADGRSQAYLGISVEKPASTEAVDATDGEVLFFGGQVADTLFSSSTGGWTQSAADAFGSPGRPYLVSVKDPYDTISPYHNWGPVAVTAKTLGSALGVTGRVVDATVARNASRRVKTLTIASVSRGTQSTTSVGGSTVESALGLRSTWFSVGVMSLQAPSPNPQIAPGTRVRLSGVVRGIRGVVVQERTRGTPWKQLRKVVPARKTGAFHFAVKPRVTTDFRLATTQDAAAFVRIRVQTG